LVQQRSPFETVAICILPDHLHAIWQCPVTMPITRRDGI
jgi:REP element-mobilizing transposase RayT